MVSSNIQQGKNNILVGVTGGIAAYKTADICSQLVKKGFQVKVMMTTAASEFITPLTFESITGHPVALKMFDRKMDWSVEHISWAQWADMVLLCPATANIVGKLASGICDDFVSTTLLATKAPCLIAPAMNTNMYTHPAFQDNLSKLIKYGYRVIPPGKGRLACGDEGEGRLADKEDILSAVEALHKEILADSEQTFVGKTVLVTAGATREKIDPVRFLSNPSTGKMGYAIAEAFAQKGAHVKLVSGPTHLQPPAGVQFIQVETTTDMYRAVMDHLEGSDIVVKAAAVSDFRPKKIYETKIKKQASGDGMEIAFVKNPDILREVGDRKGDRILVGFAAETDNIIENGQEKIKRKNLDMLVLNDISASNAGFEKDINTVHFLYPDGSVKDLPTMSKTDLGKRIVKEIENNYLL